AAVTGKMKVSESIGYIAAQCIGAIAAAAAIKVAVPAGVLTAVGMGTPALGEGITVTQGIFMEIVLTFFLVFVIFGSAMDKRAPAMGGLFIGLTVALDIMCGGPISGAAMNPARHLGPALLGGGLGHVWLYWVGPIIGAVLAGLIYVNVLEEK
ncbi:MAG: aquaporin, partial [Candidatus Lindowbacteria bacterium]|nr:aquaporin [Candidatus Lindowbacteria bacterium]